MLLKKIISVFRLSHKVIKSGCNFGFVFHIVIGNEIEKRIVMSLSHDLVTVGGVWIGNQLRHFANR